jgi:hypothetical protein
MKRSYEECAAIHSKRGDPARIIANACSEQKRRCIN